jgi:hypothetical protein
MTPEDEREIRQLCQAAGGPWAGLANGFIHNDATVAEVRESLRLPAVVAAAPAPPSRRPAASGGPSALAAAFERDVIARRQELAVVAAECAKAGLDPGLVRPHLAGIASWGKHFDAVHAATAASPPAGRGVAADTGWDNAFAAARARR